MKYQSGTLKKHQKKHHTDYQQNNSTNAKINDWLTTHDMPNKQDCLFKLAPDPFVLLAFREQDSRQSSDRKNTTQQNKHINDQQ